MKCYKKLFKRFEKFENTVISNNSFLRSLLVNSSPIYDVHPPLHTSFSPTLFWNLPKQKLLPSGIEPVTSALETLVLRLHLNLISSNLSSLLAQFLNNSTFHPEMVCALFDLFQLFPGRTSHSISQLPSDILSILPFPFFGVSPPHISDVKYPRLVVQKN